MIECLARPNVWNQCKKITGEKPLVHLRGQPIQHWEFEGFYDGFSGYTVYNKGLVSKIIRESSSSPRRMAVRLFSTNGEKIFQGFINECYHGDWREAILAKKTFGYLWNELEVYFDDKRRQFMEKTNKLIEQMPKQLMKDGRIRTNSHGGVANLLKVLTKTMQEQGSSIRTIAKVQYAICTQAGIYIPDEFITDVLIAADINPDVWNDDKSKY